MAELRVRYDSDFLLIEKWVRRGMLGGHAKKMIGYIEKMLDSRWTFDELTLYISCYKRLVKARGSIDSKVMERAVQWMVFHPNPDTGDQNSWFNWFQEARDVEEEAGKCEAKAATGKPVAGKRNRQVRQNEPEAPEAPRARSERNKVSPNVQPVEASPSQPIPGRKNRQNDQNEPKPQEAPRARGERNKVSPNVQPVEAGPSRPTLGRKNRQNDQNEPEALEVPRVRGERNFERKKVSPNAQPVEADPSRPTPVGKTTVINIDLTTPSELGKSGGLAKAAGRRDTANCAEQDVAGGLSQSLSFQPRHVTTPVSKAKPSRAIPGRTASFSLSSLNRTEIEEQKTRDNNLNANSKNLSKEDPQQDPMDDIDAKLSALSSTFDGVGFRQPLAHAASRETPVFTVWKRDSSMGPLQPLHRQRSTIPLDRDLDAQHATGLRKLSRSVSPDTLLMQAEPTAEALPRPQTQTAGQRGKRAEYRHDYAQNSSRDREEGGNQHPRDVFGNPELGNNEPFPPLGNHTVERPHGNSTPQQRRIVSDNYYKPTPGPGRASGRKNLDYKAYRSQSYNWSGIYNDRRRV
ncbi:hypothetical protein BGX38DRAFT_1143944 [Terfezia claveryi]|nr:hypothetical protein BGX38DRAFT_1143944 [Terfezia claveryi]